MKVSSHMVELSFYSHVIQLCVCIVYTVVSGDANFVMTSTRLTIGGFTQPGVARNLIDMPANSEKGLSHRFVWIFPKPLFGKFASLEEIQRKFGDELGM